MSPVEAFATEIKLFDRKKNVLDRLIVHSKTLDFVQVKGQIAATCS